jgi:prepilin-type N-terminal cleavage/methylation domain-containing protein
MKKTKQNGFTLVETLVAITILVVVISAAFGAAQNGISLSTFSKNQIIAFYLASEGVEQIRNMRDENGLKGQNWLQGLAFSSNDPCYFGKTCTIDAVNNIISPCSGEFGSCLFLKEDKVTGFYGYTTGWPDTIFRREIQLKQIANDSNGNPREVSVTVRMSWAQGLLNRQFEIRENILNWH